MARKRSRASTATSDQESDSEQSFAYILPEEIPEDLLNQIRHKNDPSQRLIIAVDFGTTFSAVSYVALAANESVDYISLERIRSIKNFPNDWNADSDDRMKNEVPTEIMYPKDPKFRAEEGLIYKPQPQELDEGDSDNDGTVEMDGEGEGEDLGTPGLVAAEDSAPAESRDTNEILAMYMQADTFQWGYAVHELWSLPSAHLDKTNRAMARFKLLLDESPATKDVRDSLRGTLDALKRRKILKSEVEVIADFLTCLLRHTRSELDAEGYDSSNDSSYHVEMVLCVPAIWSQKACRDMQTALALAMRNAGLKGVAPRNNSIQDLFLVSEPEAAAAYALANDWQIVSGDTFVLLDAGGGTVDANTYEVSATTPLRLSRELVRAGGGLFGSSFLNKGFRELLKAALEDETYLEKENETIDGIIEKIIINEFEYRIKRSFDYTTARGMKRFSVSGLRDNMQKGFARGAVHVSVERIEAIFMHCLEGIADIMITQIAAAKKGGHHVKKVVLIGGFGASPSLKKYLDRRLAQHCAETGCDIKLLRPENTTNTVATGAVLRAVNKENGPERYAKSSYGILRTEHFKAYDEHKGFKPTYDALDGLPYIRNTIDWICKLGQILPSPWECPTFVCSHTFDCSPKTRFICREVLYVSDRSTLSHYKRTHPFNKGCELVGDIEVDLTFLRDEGKVQPIEPKKDKRRKNTCVRHYQVNYTMLIRVADRDLKCYAIYGGKLVQQCQINIAAAFRPGVK